jgi:riboflavin biosynthesis pyrimidine reductase
VADDALTPLTPGAAPRSARELVRALALREHPPAGRPRVVAAMIASADGRATLGDRSVGLGNAADRALLRELRAAVDALLVGTGTLRAERYANLLDDGQRAARVDAGLDEHPLVATVSRRLEVPVEIGLFAEPAARVRVYTEAEGELAGRGAQVAVHRFAAGELSLAAALEDLRIERGAQAVLCEGGPTLLRALVAGRCLDHLLQTLAPLIAGGDGPNVLEGDALDPPVRLGLHDVHRAGDHLFMHYLPVP